MMTFYTAYQLQKSLFPGQSSALIKVPKYCTQVIGTSAQLVKNDTLPLEELFFAMLLPSGNDAALTIADFFGHHLQSSSNQSAAPPYSYQFQDNLRLRHFLREMNLNAQRLNMTNTVFDSPHGLQNYTSLSTAYDMALLTHKCMQIPTFRRVVSTCVHTFESELNFYEW